MTTTYIQTALSGIFTLIIALSLVAHASAQESESDRIFPKGEPGPDQFFTGNVWVTGLIENDDLFTTLGGNVEFEAGARSHWHSHPAGQILIVIDGTGYHQIEGQPKEIIEKGDVIKCPPNVNHWHGASQESSMQHIYLIPNTENWIVEWGEPVTDEQYSSN